MSCVRWPFEAHELVAVEDDPVRCERCLPSDLLAEEATPLVAIGVVLAGEEGEAILAVGAVVMDVVEGREDVVDVVAEEEEGRELGEAKLERAEEGTDFVDFVGVVLVKEGVGTLLPEDVGHAACAVDMRHDEAGDARDRPERCRLVPPQVLVEIPLDDATRRTALESGGLE
jgi:hypothetical protein